MNEHTSWLNPYIKKLVLFPEQIFRFEEFEEDREAVCDLVENSSEVFCELGSGSGGHLLECARGKSDAVFFGFEIRFKRAVRTIEKAQREGISGVYVLRTKAEDMERIFPHRSLDAIYVNFPDPWDKRRWKKHRILNVCLLERAGCLLKEDGFLSIKSDHKEYFQTFLKEVRQNDLFSIEIQTEDLYASPYLSENIPTEFENLFCSKGFPIYYAKLRMKNG